MAAAHREQSPTLPEPPGIVHFKATVEYDGTEFNGFQRQPDGRTVQDVIEQALSRLHGGERVRLRAAGRTDAGVHATGQVIDFHLRWARGTEALGRALTALTPEDVAIRAVEVVPAGFHPRYDALSRRYLYTLHNAPTPSPLLRRTALHEPRPLDEQAMVEAVRPLLGTHDFASFGRATTPSESTVRTLRDAAVWREGELVRVMLEANGFLQRMVRSVVGSLLVVGRGDAPPGWLAELLAARDRSAAAAVIPPHGLCLVKVTYPEPSEQ